MEVLIGISLILQLLTIESVLYVVSKVKKERGKYAYVYGLKCKEKRIMQKILKENQKPYLKRNGSNKSNKK